MPQLTERHLRIAAESARHWPTTIRGAHLGHINGHPPPAEWERVWSAWYQGKGGTPVPIEVPG